MPRQYSEDEATQIAFWVEEMIGEDLEFPEDIIASLRSGIDLCRLVNAARPCIVSVIKPEGDDNAHAANIQAFLDSCLELGVSEKDLLELNDLLDDDGDIQRVLRNIVALEKAVRGDDLPRLALVEQCDNELCANKIEGLMGEIGSLKKHLQDKEEDNREVRQENFDLREKLAEQEDLVALMRTKIQALERAHADSEEKYRLAMIDIQVLKREYEDLQQIQLVPLNDTPPPNPLSHSLTSPLPVIEEVHSDGGGSGKQSKSFKNISRSVFFMHKRNPSSPDMKKLEDMKKFIKEEKKKLKKQEREREKEREKELKLATKHSSSEEVILDGASTLSPDSSVRTTPRGPRSRTLSFLTKKEKEVPEGYYLDKSLSASKEEASNTHSAPASPVITRERSRTAAPKVML